MTRAESTKQIMADFKSQVEVCRKNPEDMTPDLSLAIGVLLGQGYPGCAAAVAVLAQTHTNIDLDLLKSTDEKS